MERIRRVDAECNMREVATPWPSPSPRAGAMVLHDGHAGATSRLRCPLRARRCRADPPLRRRDGARSRGRSADRRARTDVHRRDPRPVRADRRHRGFPPRVQPLDPRGAGADGARRGAAPRAGLGDPGPPDRGQARRRRLGEARRRRGELVRARLDLGAGPLQPHRRDRRQPRQHHLRRRAAARPAGGARRDEAGDAHPRPSLRARRDDRRGAEAGEGPRRARLPPLLRHARRGGADRGRRRRPTSPRTGRRSPRSANRRGRRSCRRGRASR